MGTRADFYIKTIETEPVEWEAPIQWIGSIAWDGYPSGIGNDVLKSQNYREYGDRLKEFFSDRDDVTYPENGWPWPWDSSEITDFTYLFDCTKGKVLVYYRHGEWFDVSRYKDEDFYPEDVDDLIIEANYKLPMFDDKNVARGNRSGLITFGI